MVPRDGGSDCASPSESDIPLSIRDQFMSLLLYLLLSIAPAFSADYSEAEHVRISSDIQQMASHQLWEGVEKKFQELVAMEAAAGQSIMTFDDLLAGAYAARARGRMLDARERLSRAAKLDGPLERSKEVADWLDSIRSNFGQVRLLAHNARNVPLTVDVMPLDPDQRLAVETAVAMVQRTGAYQGLLPKGNYSFAGHAFKVEPGIAVSIEASPRLKRTEGNIIVHQEPMTEGSP